MSQDPLSSDAEDIEFFNKLCAGISNMFEDAEEENIDIKPN